MNIKTLLLILCSVSISAFAQISLKTGMSENTIQRTLESGLNFETALSIMTNFHVIAGLFLYGFGAILWLFVLARVDVSYAYPFVGLGFLLTMLFAVLFLQEPVKLIRLIGTIFVVIGVVMVSRS